MGWQSTAATGVSFAERENTLNVLAFNILMTCWKETQQKIQFVEGRAEQSGLTFQLILF